jgi:pimeloyl-ACP methyl ester carboxylesterase
VQDITRRVEFPFAKAAYRAQLFAGATHDALFALGSLAVPTLVVHGAEDRVIPQANAYLLANTIPGADLHIVDSVGHIYATEEPSVDDTIASFLESV